jgi:nicotinamide-nucleotide amidase
MDHSLEEIVIQKLREKYTVLCSVESCTGGLIAHRLTNISGASEVFWGSTVTYDNSAKSDLGVDLVSIQEHGAVSLEVAQALAEKGLQRMMHSLKNFTHSHSLLHPQQLVCISTTGIAGPKGGTLEKPVGLCYLGIASSKTGSRVEKFNTPNTQTRLEIKNQFATQALEIVLRNL